MPVSHEHRVERHASVAAMPAGVLCQFAEMPVRVRRLRADRPRACPVFRRGREASRAVPRPHASHLRYASASPITYAPPCPPSTSFRRSTSTN